MSPFFPFNSFCLSIFGERQLLTQFPFFNRVIPSFLHSIFNSPPTKQPPIMLVMQSFSHYGVLLWEFLCTPTRVGPDISGILIGRLMEYSWLETIHCQAGSYCESRLCWGCIKEKHPKVPLLLLKNLTNCIVQITEDKRCARRLEELTTATWRQSKDATASQNAPKIWPVRWLQDESSASSKASPQWHFHLIPPTFPYLLCLHVFFICLLGGLLASPPPRCCIAATLRFSSSSVPVFWSGRIPFPAGINRSFLFLSFFPFIFFPLGRLYCLSCFLLLLSFFSSLNCVSLSSLSLAFSLLFHCFFQFSLFFGFFVFYFEYLSFFFFLLCFCLQSSFGFLWFPVSLEVGLCTALGQAQCSCSPACLAGGAASSSPQASPPHSPLDLPLDPPPGYPSPPPPPPPLGLPPSVTLSSSHFFFSGSFASFEVRVPFLSFLLFFSFGFFFYLTLAKWWAAAFRRRSLFW